MAPSPQTYGAQAGYGGHQEQQQQQQQYETTSGYEQQAPSYRAPSSASVSTYDERSPANSYAGKGSSYGRGQAGYGQQQQQSGYGQQQQQAGYAKAVPKYEEPYVSSG